MPSAHIQPNLGLDSAEQSESGAVEGKVAPQGACGVLGASQAVSPRAFTQRTLSAPGNLFQLHIFGLLHLDGVNVNHKP